MSHSTTYASRTSSGSSTPTSTGQASSYIPSALSSAVGSFFRRSATTSSSRSASPASRAPVPQALILPQSNFDGDPAAMNGVFTPPHRNVSPTQPPPLTPLTLRGHTENNEQYDQLLSRTVAEEIRLLVPPRLQLCEQWCLIYGLEQDGVSLSTLYKKCEELRGLRNGFVLVVKDGLGDLFGAYLTDAPYISSHYFGTGECFLWRASVLTNPLMNLPPPPSADTTHAVRSTTIAGPRSPTSPKSSTKSPLTSAHLRSSLQSSGTSTPERIRFKAFPYSGENDYLMLCNNDFLSIGGGDGKYGLWLDDSFERGISSRSVTFGNEPLSEEGEKFDILGVEIWSVGTLK